MPDDLDHLQLAFAYHAVSELLRADAHVAPPELAFLAARFPGERMAEAGFVDAAGRLTHAFEEARDLALVELPDRLPEARKLELIELIADASAADGVLAPEEADALSALARILGVEDRRWIEHLEALIEAGRLRRDATGVHP